MAVAVRVVGCLPDMETMWISEEVVRWAREFGGEGWLAGEDEDADWSVV